MKINFERLNEITYVKNLGGHVVAETAAPDLVVGREIKGHGNRARRSACEEGREGDRDLVNCFHQLLFQDGPAISKAISVPK